MGPLEIRAHRRATGRAESLKREMRFLLEGPFEMAERAAVNTGVRALNIPLSFLIFNEYLYERDIFYQEAFLGNVKNS